MALKRKDELYMTDENGNAVKPSTVDKTAPTGSVSHSATSKEETKPSTPTTTAPSAKIPGLDNKAPSLPGYTAPKYSAPTYAPSEAVNQAAQMLSEQMAKAPGQYNSPWSTQLNETLDKILNREKFSYDFNGDAFYQQYKDKFTQQARMASEDAVARASAMTGGYGNSYAATAGAQAFNEQMGQLNDIIPELYQMAYDKYAREGQELKDAYSLLAAREAEAYGKYRDEKADFLTERDYLTGRLESEKADDYNRFVDDRNFGYGQYVDDRNFGYGANRDTVADKKWQSEFDLAIDQYNKNLELSQREAAAKEQAAIDEATADRNKFLDDLGKELREKFDNNEDMANHLATLVNRDEITQEEAAAILDKYAYADLADREWSAGDNDLMLGLPSGNTILKDQYGNQMTFMELHDKLISEGMTEAEFEVFLEKMLNKWGYEPL